MTAYHGGKHRSGKTYSQVIVSESMDMAGWEGMRIKGYCEPFCGMLGVYRHVPDLYTEEGLTKLKYKAGDGNKSVVDMWQAAQKGWKPPTKLVSRTEFKKIGSSSESSADKGFIGHAYGYMGKYFKPYRKRTKSSIENDSERVCSIAAKLGKVQFKAGSYTQYSNLKDFVIYCDPPYEVQAYYYEETGERKTFDHARFWDWCRKMARHNLVFVSEYNAPSDFEQIFSMGVRTAGSNRTEKIYAAPRDYT
jgi:DNA adenine methylase